MKHCILMTAYKDIDMINEFISLIPDDWGCYVHLDKKCTIEPNSINLKANTFKEYEIYWGGVEHLKAFIFLLDKAYSDGRNHYDYYHLVTGQDFFAIQPEDFDTILSDNKKSYLEVHKCPFDKWDKCWGGGFDILRYRTLASYCDIRFGYGRILNKILVKAQKVFHMARPLPSYPIYGGSVYCSLSGEAVKEVLYGELSKDLLGRLRNSIIGEEIFFQTVLMNSELRESVESNKLRYIDWECETPPKVLSETDFDVIMASKVLFCRKIDSKYSRSLLDRLLKHIGQ